MKDKQVKSIEGLVPHPDDYVKPPLAERMGLGRSALNVEEAAARMGVGRDGVYKAIFEGKLKAKKFGKRTLILAKDVDAFLEALPPLTA